MEKSIYERYKSAQVLNWLLTPTVFFYYWFALLSFSELKNRIIENSWQVPVWRIKDNGNQ